MIDLWQYVGVDTICQNGFIHGFEKRYVKLLNGHYHVDFDGGAASATFLHENLARGRDTFSHMNMSSSHGL